MSRLAYVDLVSGAAGDMLLAACAHAGRRAGLPAEERVTAVVASLGLDCQVSFDRAIKAGLHCLVAKVSVPDERFEPDRLIEAIRHTEASERAKDTAVAGLRALVRAEADVHGKDPRDVQLHELGSADTAADLIGVAAGLEALGVTTVAASAVPAPRGWISSAHGALPLPAPATLELLKGATLYGVDTEVELVTPTAAAILVAHGAHFGLLPQMTLEEVGVGGGTKDLERPNVCRLLIGTPTGAIPDAAGAEAAPSTKIPAGVTLAHDVLLETNIDDQSPEMLAHAMEALFAAGVKDAWFTSIVMKKSRPAFQLSILVDPSDEGQALDVLFRHTTTLGARRREVSKWVLDREILHVPVRGTNIRVKVGRLGGESVTVSPEFEDCVHVAERTGVALGEVYREATEKAHRILGG